MTTGVVASAWWSCTELLQPSVCVYYSRKVLGLELEVLQKRLSCCSIQPNLIAVMFGYE